MEVTILVIQGMHHLISLKDWKKKKKIERHTDIFYVHVGKSPSVRAKLKIMHQTLKVNEQTLL